MAGRGKELGAPASGVVSRELGTTRLSVRERLRMIRRPAIVPDHDLGIVIPEYDPGEFSKKVILITGVSHFGGFGYETARQLVEMGAKAVAFNYRQDSDEVRAVVAELEERALQTGTQIVPLQGDISQVEQACSLVGRVVEQTGRLDVYIDNAGRIAMGAIVDQTPEDVLVDTMTNEVGPQIILGEAVKQMREQRSGRIIAIISPVADGGPDQSRYAKAKAGKFASLRSVSLEAIVRRYGSITTVCVAPAFSETAMTKEAIPKEARPTLMEIIGQETELNPSEVAEYIVYASSSKLPVELNGQVIPVFKPMRPALVE